MQSEKYYFHIEESMQGEIEPMWGVNKMNIRKEHDWGGTSIPAWWGPDWRWLDGALDSGEWLGSGARWCSQKEQG